MNALFISTQQLVKKGIEKNGRELFYFYFIRPITNEPKTETRGTQTAKKKKKEQYFSLLFVISAHTHNKIMTSFLK